MAKKKHQPPAKIKYDQGHPIISIRLTPDLKKKLEELNIAGHKSVADFLKKAVELQTPSLKSAYIKGYQAAQSKYVVNYNCCVCGKKLTIDTRDEQKAAAQYMKDAGWAHSKCLEK